jgi:hypothetical protein
MGVAWVRPFYQESIDVPSPSEVNSLTQTYLRWLCSAKIVASLRLIGIKPLQGMH